MSDFSQVACDYFAVRGIHPSLAATVGVCERAGSLLFPYSTPDGSRYYRERSLNGGSAKVKQPAGQSLTLWWPLGRPSNHSAIICEGESDALAALEPLSESRYSYLEVAAVPGTGFPVKRFAEQLAEARIREVFLAFDADDAGRSYAGRATSALEELGVAAVRLELEDGTDLAENIARAEDPAGWIENALADSEAADEGREERPTDPALTSPFRRSEASNWPMQPADAAFHGLPGRIIDLIGPHSEAAPVAMLAQLLDAFGNACGPGPGFRVGLGRGNRHHLNLFVLVVGPTAAGRKGTSLAEAGHVVQAADATWPGVRSASFSSGEGVIHAVRDRIVKRVPIKEKGRIVDYQEEEVDPGVEDKRLLVAEAEFANTLQVIKREGSTLSSIVRAAWDGLDLEFLVKRTQTRATAPHVSAIGHITRAELLERVTDVDIASGFLNRFIIVWAERSRSLPHGGTLAPDDPKLGELIGEVLQALRHAQTVGDMPIGGNGLEGEKARALWAQEYERLFYDDDDGVAARILARAQPQVRRLACIYALLDSSPVVEKEHLRAALALWDYSEHTVRSIFADATGDPRANRLLAALKMAGSEGVPRTEINDLFSGHLSKEDLDRILALLLRKNLAQAEKVPTAGKPREVWFAL